MKVGDGFSNSTAIWHPERSEGYNVQVAQTPCRPEGTEGYNSQIAPLSLYYQAQRGI
jgi:hypothetical protein